jgi:CBS domain-containing protein
MVQRKEVPMSRVADILARKGSDVLTVDNATTVYDAISKMVEANVGSVIVTDRDAVCGIFTERDYLRRIVLQGRTSRKTQVKEVMVERLVVVDPARDVADCMSLMTSQRIRHLPVMEGTRLVGIVSIGDVVRHLSKEREAEVRYLTDYISGKYPG